MQGVHLTSSTAVYAWAITGDLFLSPIRQGSRRLLVGSEWTLREYEKDELAYLKHKQGVEQVRVLSSKYLRLRRAKARRFIVQFTEGNESVVTDHIIALYKGVEYELILHTLVDRYQRDRRVFEKVAASWQLTRRG